MKALCRALALSLSMGVLGAGVVLAQDGAGPPARATDPSEDRAASFRAVEGGVSEDVPGGALLVGAYGTVLVLLLGYVLWLGTLQAGASREVARLAAALEKGKARPRASSDAEASAPAEPTKGDSGGGT